MSEEKKIIRKKTLTGIVVSDAAEKTAVVQAEFMYKDARYKKYKRKSKKFHVHDVENKLSKGDTVTIIESRPISKLKRWAIHRVH